MKTSVLAAVMTLLPGVAAAQVQVSVGVPRVEVTVNGPSGPPPGPGYVWEPPRWVYHNGAQVYQQGYWRQVAPPPPVTYEQPAYTPVEAYVVDVPPPPPVVEVRPAAPWHGAVWVAGYWNWHHRRHHWTRGYWARHRPGHIWEAHRWERRGNRWAHHAGGWRRHDRGHDDDRRRNHSGGWKRGHDDDRRHGGYRYGHRGGHR
jgi:hypothetical protein